MRIFWIFHGRFPSEKAAALFAGRSAESFAHEGVDVTLIVPRRRNAMEGNQEKLTSVQLVYIPTIDVFGIPVMRSAAFYISFVTFSLAVAIYVFFRAKRDDVVYSNESLPLLLTGWRYPAVYEVHDFPEQKSWLYKALFQMSHKILATNAWKADELGKRFAVPREKIIVEPNAVDVDAFDMSLSRLEVRQQLSIPADVRAAVYTGHLYSWKGVDTLAGAASLMSDVQVFVVGGTEHDIEEFRKKFLHISNLHIVGHRPHAEMPLWQRAADVLVLPNTAKEEISARYTSPLKLFEYMASGTPIVASRLPSIESIVSENEAYFFEPDNEQSLADAILVSVSDPESLIRAQAARMRIADHTWEMRASRILRALSEIS